MNNQRVALIAGGIIAFSISILVAAGLFTSTENSEIVGQLPDTNTSTSTNNSFTSLSSSSAESSTTSSELPQTDGKYVNYAASKLTSDKNILFFHASWCPTCKALDSSLKSNEKNIPGGVTILKVNYDTENQLKKKYGVTYQHTLVQVDEKGDLIKKWAGGNSLNDVLEQIV